MVPGLALLVRPGVVLCCQDGRFDAFRGSDSLGGLFQRLRSLCKELPPDIQSKPSLLELKTIPPCPIAVCPSKKLIPLLFIDSLLNTGKLQ